MGIHFPYLPNETYVQVMRRRKFGLQKRRVPFVFIGCIGLVLVWFI